MCGILKPVVLYSLETFAIFKSTISEILMTDQLKLFKESLAYDMFATCVSCTLEDTSGLKNRKAPPFFPNVTSSKLKKSFF